MELSEAETNAQQEQIDKSGTNCEVELDLSRLRAEFQCLTTDYFTGQSALDGGSSRMSCSQQRIMLANQAVELLTEPHSDETEAA